MRIYVDTSVINGPYAQDINIKIDSLNFFKNVRLLNYHLYASEVTIEEIENTIQESKKSLLKKIVIEHQIEILTVVEESRWLANKYIAARIIPKKYFPDALHIAIATLYNIPVLVSWNFEHMVKIKTKLEINKTNHQHGYPAVEISSPKEV